MKWTYLKTPDRHLITELNKQNKSLGNKLSDVVIKLLAEEEVNDINEYIYPKDLFYSADLIPNISKASEIIIDAIKDKRPIIIHGDFDADGITATSILFDFLYFKCNANVVPYIPSRVDEGYGLSNESLSAILKNQDHKSKPLVITVDSGVKDNDLIDEKWFKEFDFIITDHHEMKKVNDKIVLSKKAKAIVHPRLPNSKYPFKNISGATVAWKLVCKISEDIKLKSELKSELKLEKDFDPNEYLDLIAISTVCDLMPLKGENRNLVKFGLERLNKTERIGLIELLKVSGLFEDGKLKKLDTYHIGFVIGPRLNATGRLGKALDAVKLLCTRNKENAVKLALEINNLNIERQNITKDLFLEARDEALKMVGNKLITIKGQNWPEGIVGLIAGRLTEEFSRPAIVFSISKEKVIGSARSTKSFNITETLGIFSKRLVRFGGHAGAAGLSLHPIELDIFIEEITEYTNKNFPVEEDGSIEKELIINFKIDITKLSLNLAKELKLLEPFGFDNPDPVFSISKLRVINVSQMGQEGKHIRLVLQDPETLQTISTVGFNMKDSITNIFSNDYVDIAFNLKVNKWNNTENIEIFLKDIKKS